MTMHFDENDLVSFGSYMISNARKRYIESISEDVSEEELQERLSYVSNADLVEWMRLMRDSNELNEENN